MKKLGFLFLYVFQLSCTSQTNPKINGVSFVSSREKAKQEDVNSIKEIHANHAAVMPFGFVRAVNSPEIIFNTDRQWYGETELGAAQYVNLLQQNTIGILLKPQLWIKGGAFTGTLKMNTEADWVALENTYETFILTYANLAQKAHVNIFCIGTELEQFVSHRPEYWHALISKIRKVYSGKLTYAANWDEYPKVPFWKELDFIGIDAYFPLSESKSPSVEELKIAWQPWKTKIKEFSATTKKPVLFTEFGYRSMDYTAKKPWLVDRNEEFVNVIAQANALEALLSVLWKEEWFAGGYVWKWFLNHEHAGGNMDNRFTPQNKPAQKVLKSFYEIH